jgi:hypothetical protein
MFQSLNVLGPSGDILAKAFKISFRVALPHVNVEFLISTGYLLVKSKRIWSVSPGKTAKNLGTPLLYEMADGQGAEMRRTGVGGRGVDFPTGGREATLHRPLKCVHGAEVRESVSIGT